LESQVAFAVRGVAAWLELGLATLVEQDIQEVVEDMLQLPQVMVEQSQVEGGMLVAAG
jgi:hypothetical protein